MAVDAGDGFENIGAGLAKTRLKFIGASGVRRDIRWRRRLSDLAEHRVSGSVLTTRGARTLRSRLRTNDRGIWWIRGTQLSRHPCPIANWRSGARAARDGRVAPDDLFAATPCVQANLADRPAGQCRNTALILARNSLQQSTDLAPGLDSLPHRIWRVGKSSRRQSGSTAGMIQTLS